MTLDTAVLAGLAAKASRQPWINADPIDGPGESMIYSSDGWTVGNTLMFDNEDYIAACHQQGREPMAGLLIHRPHGAWNDDARLIVAAVNALPALLAEVESLRNLRTAVLGWLDCQRCSAATGTVCMTHRPDIRAALVSEEGSRTR